MSEINFFKFEKKYQKNSTQAFEDLSYDVFCRLFNIKDGLKRTINHPIIETEPYYLIDEVEICNQKIKGEVGFQSKYVENKKFDDNLLSQFIHSLKIDVKYNRKEKKYTFTGIEKLRYIYPNLKHIIFFANVSYTKQKKYQELKKYLESNKNPLNIIEIFQSNFEQIIGINNKDIKEIYFETNEKEEKFENELILKNDLINSTEDKIYNPQLNIRRIIQNEREMVIKVYGEQGIGKTEFINNFCMENKKTKQEALFMPFEFFYKNMLSISRSSFLKKKKIEKIKYFLIDDFEDRNEKEMYKIFEKISDFGIKVILFTKTKKSNFIELLSIKTYELEKINKSIVIETLKENNINIENIKEIEELRIPLSLNSIIDESFEKKIQNLNESSKSILIHLLSKEIEREKVEISIEFDILIKNNLLKQQNGKIVFFNSIIKDCICQELLLKKQIENNLFNFVKEYILENTIIKRSIVELIQKDLINKSFIVDTLCSNDIYLKYVVFSNLIEEELIKILNEIKEEEEIILIIKNRLNKGLKSEKILNNLFKSLIEFKDKKFLSLIYKNLNIEQKIEIEELIMQNEVVPMYKSEFFIELINNEEKLYSNFAKNTIDEMLSTYNEKSDYAPILSKIIGNQKNEALYKKYIEANIKELTRDNFDYKDFYSRTKLTYIISLNFFMILYDKNEKEAIDFLKKLNNDLYSSRKLINIHLSKEAFEINEFYYHKRIGIRSYYNFNVDIYENIKIKYKTESVPLFVVDYFEKENVPFLITKLNKDNFLNKNISEIKDDKIKMTILFGSFNECKNTKDFIDFFEKSQKYFDVTNNIENLKNLDNEFLIELKMLIPKMKNKIDDQELFASYLISFLNKNKYTNFLCSEFKYVVADDAIKKELDFKMISNYFKFNSLGGFDINILKKDFENILCDYMSCFRFRDHVLNKTFELLENNNNKIGKILMVSFFKRFHNSKGEYYNPYNRKCFQIRLFEMLNNTLKMKNKTKLDFHFIIEASFALGEDLFKLYQSDFNKFDFTNKNIDKLFMYAIKQSCNDGQFYNNSFNPLSMYLKKYVDIKKYINNKDFFDIIDIYNERLANDSIESNILKKSIEKHNRKGLKVEYFNNLIENNVNKIEDSFRCLQLISEDSVIELLKTENLSEFAYSKLLKLLTDYNLYEKYQNHKDFDDIKKILIFINNKKIGHCDDVLEKYF